MPETNFFWDPVEDNIIQERDETGAVTAEYATEPYLYGNLISQNRGGVESQYHFDPQGSTLALTDVDQQITDTYAYTAFGEVTEHSGTTENHFQYIGRKGYYNTDTFLSCLVRRRLLELSMARWASKDPIGYIDGMNRYQYVGNNAALFIDPSGLIITKSLTIDELLDFAKARGQGVPQLDLDFSEGNCSIELVKQVQSGLTGIDKGLDVAFKFLGLEHTEGFNIKFEVSADKPKEEACDPRCGKCKCDAEISDSQRRMTQSLLVRIVIDVISMIKVNGLSESVRGSYILRTAEIKAGSDCGCDCPSMERTDKKKWKPGPFPPEEQRKAAKNCDAYAGISIKPSQQPSKQ